MTKINRRQFLTLSAASAGTAVISSCVQTRFDSNSSKPNSVNATRLYKSSDALLELDLEASYHPVQLGSQQANLLTYNGQVPAPRLEDKGGDTVRIRFTNSLSQPTNLHYHGLHIPVTGNADNVLLSIEPGETFNYEFTIPQDHPAGLFWYHPHRHGFVAEQLFGGLAGLFVVRGELDEIPQVKTATEEFLVLQDFALDQAGKPLPSAQMSLMTGREGELITVNGQPHSSFSIPANGLLRWRILNASPSRFYRLSLENHPFHLIATDGGALAEPVEVSELLLTPGERVDVLVQGNREPGQYRLLNWPYDRGTMGMGGMMNRRGRMGGNSTNSDPATIATLTYNAASDSVALPTQLLAVPPLPAPQQGRRFELNHGMSPGKGMVFLINGQPYERDRLDTQVQLGTVEEWEIVNTGTMDHPFHVHGNQFQVVSRNGRSEPYRAWKDTALVRRGETVRLRIPFRDFPGQTVYHCHILDHEDLGMMGTLVIQT
ncbi:MAG: multicopper oxidase family protein [Cyanophyceae cyanobacterium]